MTGAAALLPIAFGILLTRALQRDDGLRPALLRAAVVFGIVVVSVTELLSPLHAIRPVVLTAVWAGLVLAAGALCWLWRGRAPTFQVRRGTLVPLAPLGILAALTLVVALLAPPNTPDAISYHMGRVLQWSQHGDVAFYQATAQRQLFLSPWAEYAILQFQVLSHGGDRFANLVQWFAYGGCVVAASLLARRLGAGGAGQWFAAAVVASLPMALLQASSAQNDLVSTFWLAAFLWFALSASPDGDQPAEWSLVAFAAGALALAVATKGTALILAAPFLVLALLRVIRVWPPRRIAAAIVLTGLVVGVINAPLWVRNQRLYHDPLGHPGILGALRAQRFGPGPLVSNLTRNVALHLGTPWAPVNHAVESAVDEIHAAIGVDVNDPALTWSDPAIPGTAFAVAPMNRDEDRAGNLIGLLIIAGAVVIWAVRRVRLPIAGYGVACAAAALGFAVMLKWQPWNSRLHLPLFVLGTAWAAAVYSRGIGRRWLIGLGVASLVAGVPWAVSAQHRPLIPLPGDPPGPLEATRASEYFAALPGLESPFTNAADLLATWGCRDVGFMGDEMSAEYALWALLRKRESGAEVIPVGVPNPSALLPARPHGPLCAIVVQHVPPRWWPSVQPWQLAWRSGDVALFRNGALAAGADPHPREESPVR